MYPWIYAHRGVWKDSRDQNSSEAIRRAVLDGYSVETDIRDFLGEIVISHDPILEAPEIKLHDLIDLEASFALNIKSDGLFSILSHDLLYWINRTDSFFFDGSFPDLYGYQKALLPTAFRISDFESIPSINPISTVWIDGLQSDWWIGNRELIAQKKTSKLIFVSPELHGRDPKLAWAFLREERNQGNLHINICTDLPRTVAKWL